MSSAVTEFNPEPKELAETSGAAVSDAPSSGYLDFQSKVQDTNINQMTLLATDYLNHFNEVVMLIDMIGDMPEMLEEVQIWKPRTYKDHFEASTFSDKELAVAAYDFSPARFRDPFESILSTTNRLVSTATKTLEAAVHKGNPEEIATLAGDYSQNLRKLIDLAGAVINGRETLLAQDEIDRMFPE